MYYCCFRWSLSLIVGCLLVFSVLMMAAFVWRRGCPIAFWRTGQAISSAGVTGCFWDYIPTVLEAAGRWRKLPQHLKLLKDFYCRAKLVNGGSPLTEGGRPYTAPEMLSAAKLDNQQALFKVTMKTHAAAACEPPFLVNPVIKLWRNLSQSRHLESLISEYFKVAEIGCCLVLGSVEDKRCFSTLKFLKSCQRNRLGKHLPLVVRMFGQHYYTLENFPYKEAIDSWRNAVKSGRHGDVWAAAAQYPPHSMYLSFHEIMLASEFNFDWFPLTLKTWGGPASLQKMERAIWRRLQQLCDVLLLSNFECVMLFVCLMCRTLTLHRAVLLLQVGFNPLVSEFFLHFIVNLWLVLCRKKCHLIKTETHFQCQNSQFLHSTALTISNESHTLNEN